MPLMKTQEVIDLLTANPHLECVRHPNPNGLGPRTFLGHDQSNLRFHRPDKVNPGQMVDSYLPKKALVAVRTEDGFSISNGAIVYKIVAPS